MKLSSSRTYRRLAIASGLITLALTGSCTCYATIYDCYYYYGIWWGTPYCDYDYMDPWYPSGGYYPAYWSTAEPSLTAHPDPAVAPKRSDDGVTLENVIYIRHGGEFAEGAEPDSPRSLNNSYPCGLVDDDLRVLCDAGGVTPSDEDHIVLGATLVRSLDLGPDDFVALTFSFQGDDDPSNDFVPPAERQNEYFGGADTWFSATRSPGARWSFDAFRFDGSAIVSVDTNARLVLEEATAVLMVPAAEFEVEAPTARISVFRHGGDEGRGPDANWSGFVHPPLGDPPISG